jgi:hypothetical protein
MSKSIDDQSVPSSSSSEATNYNPFRCCWKALKLGIIPHGRTMLGTRGSAIEKSLNNLIIGKARKRICSPPESFEFTHISPRYTSG